MIGRLQMLMKAKRIGLAIMGVSFAMMAAPAAWSQDLACPDGEVWQVDKSALQKVITSLPSYMTQREPVLINLQALGANSGELLITFSHKNLQCIADAYRNKLAGTGTVSICKRPSC